MYTRPRDFITISVYWEGLAPPVLSIAPHQFLYVFRLELIDLITNYWIFKNLMFTFMDQRAQYTI